MSNTHSVNKSTKRVAIYIRSSSLHHLNMDRLKTQKEKLSNYARIELNINDHEFYLDTKHLDDDKHSPYIGLVEKARNSGFSHLIICNINHTADASPAFTILPISSEFPNLNSTISIPGIGSGEWNRGNTPLGYSYDSKQKVFLEHPDHSQLVKLIFILYERCQSTKGVADYLNSKNFTTPKGTPFSSKAIYVLLSNRFYIGTLISNIYPEGNTSQSASSKYQIITENHHLPIITKKQFDNCQRILGTDAKARHIRNIKNTHVLYNLMYCAYCDERMAAQSGRELRHEKGIRISRYSCPNRRIQQCSNPYTSDMKFGSFILGYILNVYNLQKSIKENSSLEDIETHLFYGLDFRNIRRPERSFLKSLYNDLLAGNYKNCFTKYQIIEKPHIILSQNADEKQPYLNEIYDLEARTYSFATVLNNSEHLDYYSLQSKPGRLELRYFFQNTLEKCYLKNGHIDTIIFKTKQQHHFQYR